MRQEMRDRRCETGDMRHKTSAFWPFLFFAASAAHEAADDVEATATDAAETASGFWDSSSNPRFCDCRQVGHTITHPLHCQVSFCAHPFLLHSDLSYLMIMSSSPCCPQLPPPPCWSHLPPVSQFSAHPFLSSHRFTGTIFEFHG